MVRSPEVLSEIELKRQQVAAWIQDVVRPVGHILREKNDTEQPIADIADSRTGMVKPEFEVREYQLDAWSALWEARKVGADRGLIHLATGLGKTSVGVFDAIKFREEFQAEHGRDPKIMFTVHQNDILQQAAERFRAFMPEASTGFYNQFQKNTGGDITFATLQALHANLDKFDPEFFDYIITDEVHHAKAHTYENVIRYFKPAFKLGLTATPNRKDEKDIRELYGNELYSKGLAEALAEGWLASPDYHIVFDDAVKEVMRSGFEIKTLKALAELFNVQPRNDVIAKNIKEEMERIGLQFGVVKTIIFCQSIEHAEEIAKLLGGKAYHSETDHSDRQDIFDEFKNGELQIITTRDMFNEGVDVPDARLLVFLRSTSSQTIFEQQLGRGLRKTVDKERVSVLDFVANIERIAFVQGLAESVAKSDSRPDLTDAISDKSRLTGDGDSASDDSGLVIHTNHGDFDFDKMTIDLLGQYTDILAKENNKFINFNNDELIELALQISPEKPLSSSDLILLSADRQFPSPATIWKRFGSLREFQEGCGFKDERLSNYSNDELVALALEISPDQPISQDEMVELSKAKEFVSPVHIHRRFGGLNNFHKACGFNKTQFKDLTNDELVALAKELSPDTPLSLKEIRGLSRQKSFVSHHEIIRRFGSISSFQEAWGRINFKDLTNDELIILARELSPDKPLQQRDINQLSKDGRFLSAQSVVARFGGIKAFQEACGFGTDFTAMSNDQLLEIAKILSPEKPLRSKELGILSKQRKFISLSTITDRFGSLKAFQEACGW